MIWKRRHYREVGLKSSFDEDVLRLFVLNDRHFRVEHKQHKDQFILKRPIYRKWLNNDDFTFLLKCLGNGNNLLDKTCICMGCSVHHRSWKHMTKQCGSIPPDARPSLNRLTESKAPCLREIAKLRNLVDINTPEFHIDLRGHFVHVLEKTMIPTYFVVQILHDHTYRALDCNTKQIRILDLYTLYQRGCFSPSGFLRVRKVLAQSSRSSEINAIRSPIYAEDPDQVTFKEEPSSPGQGQGMRNSTSTCCCCSWLGWLITSLQSV